MGDNKNLFSKGFIFVLACLAILIDLCALIYAIYAYDFGVLLSLAIIGLLSIGPIYRGLTGLRKNKE